MRRKTPAKWWWNIPIVLLLAILIPLGIRSVITDDNRYGWGTFSKQTVFDIRYYLVYKDGTRSRYKPGTELRGRSKMLRNKGSTRYSTGSVKSLVKSYVRYMYKINQSHDILRAEAVIRYRENVSRKRKLDKEYKTIFIQYPDQEWSLN